MILPRTTTVTSTGANTEVITDRDALFFGWTFHIPTSENADAVQVQDGDGKLISISAANQSGPRDGNLPIPVYCRSGLQIVTPAGLTGTVTVTVYWANAGRSVKDCLYAQAFTLVNADGTTPKTIYQSVQPTLWYGWRFHQAAAGTQRVTLQDGRGSAFAYAHAQELGPINGVLRVGVPIAGELQQPSGQDPYTLYRIQAVETTAPSQDLTGVIYVKKPGGY